MLTGCPVEPIPDRECLRRITRWYLTEGSGVQTLDYSLLLPRQRIHWVSHARGIQLAAPDGA